MYRGKRTILQVPSTVLYSIIFRMWIEVFFFFLLALFPNKRTSYDHLSINGKQESYIKCSVLLTIVF